MNMVNALINDIVNQRQTPLGDWISDHPEDYSEVVSFLATVSSAVNARLMRDESSSCYNYYGHSSDEYPNECLEMRDSTFLHLVNLQIALEEHIEQANQMLGYPSIYKIVPYEHSLQPADVKLTDLCDCDEDYNCDIPF